MKKFLLTALICGAMFPGMAQNDVTTKNETGMKTIRLVYPQWQGGSIAQWITEVNIDCGQCGKNFRCAFSGDVCNDLIEAVLKADGIIIGSPVYFAAPSGAC